MNFAREVICIALVIMCEANAHFYSLSGCPKVKVMKEFEMEKFFGNWFVVGRFNSLSTCVKVKVEKGEDEAITVHESSRPFGIQFSSHESTPRKGRKLIVLRNDTEAIFKIQRNFFSLGVKTFGVVDTDYTNYAVLWGCDPVVIGSVQNLDVLSRTPDVTMDDIKSQAEKVGVDLRYLTKVSQKNCEMPNEPEANGKVWLNNMYFED